MIGYDRGVLKRLCCSWSGMGRGSPLFDTFLKTQSVNTDCLQYSLLHSLFLFYTMSFLESDFDPLSEIKYDIWFGGENYHRIRQYATCYWNKDDSWRALKSLVWCLDLDFTSLWPERAFSLHKIVCNSDLHIQLFSLKFLLSIKSDYEMWVEKMFCWIQHSAEMKGRCDVNCLWSRYVCVSPLFSDWIQSWQEKRKPGVFLLWYWL